MTRNRDATKEIDHDCSLMFFVRVRLIPRDGTAVVVVEQDGHPVGGDRYVAFRMVDAAQPRGLLEEKEAEVAGFRALLAAESSTARAPEPLRDAASSPRGRRAGRSVLSRLLGGLGCAADTAM